MYQIYCYYNIINVDIANVWLYICLEIEAPSVIFKSILKTSIKCKLYIDI